MNAFKYAVIAVSLLLAVPLASQAQTAVPAATNAQPMSTGVVKKIDAGQGKMTISHGPLLNLDMPAMTMVFRVADPKMLTTVKTGDNIKFVAEKVNGALTVTRMEQANAAGTEGTTDTPSAAPSAPAAPSSTPASVAPPQSQLPATPTAPPALRTEQQTNAPGDPANPDAVASAPVYRSAFSGYQAATEPTQTPDKVWLAANDEMARLGEKAGPTKENAAPNGAASSPSQPAKPAGHDMKNMK